MSFMEPVARFSIRRAGTLSFGDAIRAAVEKPDFARELIEKPEKFASVFHLSDEQVEALKMVHPSDFAAEAIRQDPEVFAEGVAASEAFLRANADAIFKGKVEAVYS